MPNRPLPSAEQACSSLRADGDQFASAPLVPESLGGLNYWHPRKNKNFPLEVDTRVLAAIDTLHVDNAPITDALQSRGARVAPYEQLLQVVGTYFDGAGLVWGVSGYATIGLPLGVRADALSDLYHYLAAADARRPSLICDGGAGAGFLGLSGVLAHELGVPTLGVSPLQGLSSMAPRTHMAIYGQTYRNREVLVGLVPDLLVCAGGREGTLNECVVTIARGGIVLMLAFDDGDLDSFTNTWHTVPKLAKAAEQIVVCSSLNDLRARADEAIQLAGQRRHNRATRLDYMRRLLVP